MKFPRGIGDKTLNVIMVFATGRFLNSNGHLRDRVDVMKQSGLNGINVSILLLRLSLFYTI